LQYAASNNKINKLFGDYAILAYNTKYSGSFFCSPCDVSCAHQPALHGSSHGMRAGLGVLSIHRNRTPETALILRRESCYSSAPGSAPTSTSPRRNSRSPPFAAAGSRSTRDILGTRRIVRPSTSLQYLCNNGHHYRQGLRKQTQESQ
jgi:hypothetical protein